MSTEPIVETDKVFDCGCRVRLLKDDSQGEDYPSAPSMLFDFERCPSHCLDSKDSGPIEAFIEEFVKSRPFAKSILPAKPLVSSKVVEGCGRGKHDYQLVAGKNYAKCSKCVSTKTVKAKVESAN